MKKLNLFLILFLICGLSTVASASGSIHVEIGNRPGPHGPGPEYFRMKWKADRVLNETDRCLRAAERVFKPPFRERDLDRAFDRQERARDFYHSGFFQSAINLSLQARWTANQILEEDRRRRIPPPHHRPGEPDVHVQLHLNL